MLQIHILSSKSTLEPNKGEEHAVAWKWPPLLVTSPHGVTLWTKKHWRLALFVFASVCCKIGFHPESVSDRVC